MKTFSICALALMGCSLTSKLNLPSLTTSTSNEPAPRSSRVRTSPTPVYASNESGPAATPVVKAGPAPASYAWCNKAKGEGDVDRALTDEDPDRSIPAIVENLCRPDGDAKAKRDQLEARRQYWMQRMAMSEADWAADVPAWAAVPYSTRNTAKVAGNNDLAWSKLRATQQFALLAEGSTTTATAPNSYIADSIELTQAGRVSLVANCIHTNWDNEVNAAEWAVCQPDIDALDGSTFAAELRADASATPYDRMVVRVGWANLRPKLIEHTAKVNKLLSGDEAYGKIFEIVRTAHKEWAANASSHTAALALLRRLDDVRSLGSRKGLPGCGEEAWSMLTSAIGKLPAKEFVGIVDNKLNRPLEDLVGPILNSPEAYLAAAAYAGCAKNDFLADTLRKELLYWPGFRGPRTTAMTKLIIANLQPDRGDEIGYAKRGTSFSGIGDFAQSEATSGTGVIESVAASGASIRVTFVKNIQEVDVCVQWRKTNRISRILPDGTVWYVDECVKRELKPNNFAPSPSSVHKRFAAGLTKGSIAVIAGNVVVATYPKLGAAPAVILGTPVK